MDIITQKHKTKVLAPKLRFKGFEDSWKPELLGNTCKVTTGGRDTQNREDDGKYPFFVRSNTVERINTYSFDGEAILTSGDGVGVGKNFHYINGKFDFHQRVYALLNFKENYSGRFIYQVFVEKFHKRVMRLSAKNSVDSVRMNMITEMIVHFPSLPEQQKIAGFLSAVDEKIQQLSRKKQLLEQYKKGIMQQLFSGKLRFKDENGKAYPKWEEKKLGDCLKSVSTKQFQIQSKEYKLTGQYKVIDQGKDLIAGYTDNKSALFTSIPIIVFGDHTTILKYVDFEFVVGADGTKLLKNMGQLNLKYLFYNLSFNNVKQEGYKRHFSLLSEVFLQIPAIEEQKKIANFLSGIDAKIVGVTNQINQSQQFKKGLLQQMFV